VLVGTSVADVVINEIHYDPEPNTRRDSFVELYNAGTNSVDLSGWRFSDGVDFTFESGTELAAGEFIVVVENTNTFGQGNVSLANQVDLADLVGGGNGTLPGTGSFSGIQAANGAVNQGSAGGLVGEAVPGSYYAVAYDTVDGVFVPNGSLGAQVISSSGLVYDFAGSADTDGSWGPFINGPGPIDDPSNGGGLAVNFGGDPDNHSMIGAHAQKGITFDIDAIETLFDGQEVTNFTCIAGDSRPKPGGLVDILILLDGHLVASGIDLVNNEFAIDVMIKTTNRFLTLVCTSSGNTINSDHGYFGDPFLQLEPTGPVTNTPVRIAGAFTGSLSNDGEKLTLRDAFDSKIDEVDYRAEFPWPVGALGTGHSMELIHPGMDNDLGGSWRSGTELTPGVTNSVYALNAAPHMRQVDHSPSRPLANEAATVSVKVTDPDGVQSVLLFYQVVLPGAYLPAYLAKSTAQLLSAPLAPLDVNPAFENPANWIGVAMSSAGDDVYSAMIPGQINRALVRYRIVAEDALGVSVRIPYLDDPNLNFAYYCYDGVPAYTATERTVEPGGAPFTHTEVTMRSLPVYSLITTEADLTQCNGYDSADRIPSNNFDARSAFNWTGTFIYGEKVFDHIGYRLRQRNARYAAVGKRSMRFRFNRGNYIQLYDLNGEKYPEKWRTINSHKTRGSRGDYNFGLVELSSALLWETFGVPAPQAHWYHFRVVQRADEAPAGVNGQHLGDFYGYYTAMEDYDRRFLSARNMDRGNLYKLKSYITEGTNVQRYQSPTGLNDGSDFENIIFNLRNTQSDTWLDEHVDYTHWNRYHAVVEAIRHFDVQPNTGEHLKNRAFYFQPSPGTPYGLLQTLPWDADASWGPTYNAGEDFAKAAIFSSVNRPEYLKRYRNTIREFRDLVWQPDQISMLLDRMATRVAPLVPADRDRWLGAPAIAGSENTGDVSTKLADMKKFAWDGGSWIGDNATVQRVNGTDDYLDDLGADAAIPDMPTIVSVGPLDYPVNELSFQCSAYTGVNPFSAMEWRVGEVFSTNSPTYSASTLMVFEYDLKWGSGLITNFNNQMSIPSDALLAGVSYRTRVRFLDNTGRWSHWSAPAAFTAGAPSNLTALQDHLRVSELMYHAAGGSNFDFIEFHNTSTSVDLDLGGVAIVAGSQFTFAPGVLLGPNEYIVVAKLPGAAFDELYGTASMPVLGPYAQNISNDGERITVLPPGGGAPLIDFVYGDGRGWPLEADGAGHSLIPILMENQRDGRLDHPINWRASGSIHGSAGASDVLSAIEIRINEFAAHTDLSDANFPDHDSNDWIELYNPSTLAGVSFSTNYFLSDDAADLSKWMIPAGGLGAGAWISYDEISGFHQPVTNGFGLNKSGEQLFLSYLPGTSDDRVVDSVRFKAQENGRSYGRYPDGHENLYAMPLTRDSANQLDAVPHDVVIREIMFAPAGSNYLEYVELFNPGATSVDLFNADGNWRMDGGIDFGFPSNTTVAAGKYLVLVSFDPSTNSAERTAFISAYGQNQLMGPYSGKLSNLGERIALEKPQASDLGPGLVDWIIVDEVYYYQDFPWPSGTVDSGLALHRLHLSVAGNQATNWLGIAASPGITAPPVSLDISQGRPAWMASPGVAYFVEASDDLEPGTWEVIGMLTGDGLVQYHDTSVMNRRYYRLRLVE
jgi:hypothetical protein